MARAGRPRSVDRPPCPTCMLDDRVVAHGFSDAGGARRRVFRCARCAKRFTPGASTRRADEAVRAAVRRVRGETGANYRLLAGALSRQLGIPVTHTTVGEWCRRAPAGPEPDGTPCQYLSLLWALKQEIEQELRGPG